MLNPTTLLIMMNSVQVFFFAYGKDMPGGFDIVSIEPVQAST
jgi:hypothetical protein